MAMVNAQRLATLRYAATDRALALLRSEHLRVLLGREAIPPTEEPFSYRLSVRLAVFPAVCFRLSLSLAPQVPLVRIVLPARFTHVGPAPQEVADGFIGFALPAISDA